jgi:putative transposase
LALPLKGYRGKESYVKKKLGWTLEIVGQSEKLLKGKAAPKRGFLLEHWRWIVERTFGWIGRYRRHSKDFETTISSSETWLCIAMVRLMLYRLAPQ